MRENGSLRPVRSASSLASIDSSATIQPADTDAKVNAPSVYPRTASAIASMSSTSVGGSSTTSSVVTSASSSSSIASKRSARTNGITSATPATTPAAPNGTPSESPRRRTRNTSASSASELGIAPARTQYCVVIVLSSRNNSFDRKSLVLPFYPEVLKLGRQTSQKTLPSPDNGYFDSRVLSRQHAEIWADKLTRKVWIKDAKSSNGTYINGERLSQDGRESQPHELKRNDILELGIDISNNDNSALLHRKISAVVERISVMSLQSGDSSLTQVNVLGNGSGTIPTTQQQQQQQNQTSQTMIGPRSRQKKAEALDVALFGDVDTSLEDLALGHSRNSVGGLFMKSGISSSSNIEMAVKTLAEQIHTTRVETAKLESVRKMLSQIQNQQKKHNHLKEEQKAKNHESLELHQRVQDLEDEVRQGRDKIQLLEKELDAARAQASAAAIASESETISLLRKQLNEVQKENKMLHERVEVAEQQAESSTIQLSLLEQQQQEQQKQQQQQEQQEQQADIARKKNRSYSAPIAILIMGLGLVLANKFFREHVERWVGGITSMGTEAV